MLLPSTPRRRPGFTLIELLVVMAIIAILVALLGAGIFYVYRLMADTGARNDLSQQAAACQAFKAKYGIHPPDHFRLYSNQSDYQADTAVNGSNSLAAISLTTINRMWPNIGAFSGIAWNGQAPFPPGNYVDLEGDQCLVFFLAGIPGGAAGQGFSTNPKNPAAPGGTRVGPFYEFQAGRFMTRSSLIAGTGTGATPGNGSQWFASYKDYYGNQPYIYFSSGGRKNGYSGYSILADDPPPLATKTAVMAYSNAGQYLAPDTFQIICAGRDGRFNTGPYNSWTPATAASISQPGLDDMTSFYEPRMGVPQ